MSSFHYTDNRSPVDGGAPSTPSLEQLAQRNARRIRSLFSDDSLRALFVARDALSSVRADELVRHADELERALDQVDYTVELSHRDMDMLLALLECKHKLDAYRQLVDALKSLGHDRPLTDAADLHPASALIRLGVAGDGRGVRRRLFV